MENGVGALRLRVLRTATALKAEAHSLAALGLADQAERLFSAAVGILTGYDYSKEWAQFAVDRLTPSAASYDTYIDAGTDALPKLLAKLCELIPPEHS